VRYDLNRIHELDRAGPSIHAVIAINPDAIIQARALDEERRKSGVRGPLHGIPVLIKDNIETMDRMPTTAGSLALLQNQAVADAPVVAALRAAGAVILGKTNLSEWANFRSNHSSSGWSAVGGLTRNPYVLDRSACGSSSGSGAAVAAGMAVAALGSETDGSVTCPSSINGLVGLKPTVGLLSQQGIVPISKSQDTAGPMARSVTDIAILLTQLVRHAPGSCPMPSNDCANVDYQAELDASWLKGKRIGVLRFKAGSHPEMDEIYERALSHLRAAGAVLFNVDAPDMTPIGAAEQVVLLNEFKTGINAYLDATPAAVKTRDLQQLIDFNRASPYELELFGQDVFLQAQETKGPEDADYKKALETSRRLAGEQGIDRLLREQTLDLLVAPTTSASWRVDRVNGDSFGDSFTTLSAVSGYPHLTVPMGQVQGLPVGLSFIGTAWSESKLLAAGFSYETHSPGFDPPKYIPTLESPALPAFQPKAAIVSEQQP
jgi:amidase